MAEEVDRLNPLERLDFLGEVGGAGNLVERRPMLSCGRFGRFRKVVLILFRISYRRVFIFLTIYSTFITRCVKDHRYRRFKCLGTSDAGIDKVPRAPVMGWVIHTDAADDNEMILRHQGLLSID